jgi:hypothetical protein
VLAKLSDGHAGWATIVAQSTELSIAITQIERPDCGTFLPVGAATGNVASRWHRPFVDSLKPFLLDPTGWTFPRCCCGISKGDKTPFYPSRTSVTNVSLKCLIGLSGCILKPCRSSIFAVLLPEWRVTSD